MSEQAIKTAADLFRSKRQQGPHKGVLPPLPSAVLTSKGAFPNGKTPSRVVKKNGPVAIVNHGRWIVVCPTEGCGGAQVGDPEDPRFFCSVCKNGDRSVWLAVVYPDGEFIEELNAVMGTITSENMRNWSPQQTIAEVVEAAGQMP